MPQYSRGERIAIFASLGGAGMLGVFFLGMYFGSGSAGRAVQENPASVTAGATPEAAVPPAVATVAGPNAVARDAQRHLDAAESMVAQALASLQGLADTPGSAAEAAFGQTKAVAQDIADAQAYLAGHPELTVEAIAKNVPIQGVPMNAQTVALRPALEDLSAALAEIQKIPHGLDGARDKAIADIAQTNSMVAAAGRVAQPVQIPQPVLMPDALKAMLVATATPARFAPFRFAPSPADGAEMVLSTIRTIRAAGLPDLGNAASADVSPPLRVFNASPAQLTGGRGLETAIEEGYSYFVDSNGKTAAREILRLNPSTGKSNVISRTLITATLTAASRYLEDVEPALGHLAAASEIKDGSYEPRLLTIAAPLSIQALWLTSDKGGPDFVYVLAAASQDLPLQKLMPAGEFIKSLEGLRTDALLTAVATPTPAAFGPLRFAPAPGNGAAIFLTNVKRNIATEMPEITNTTLADVLPPLREFTLIPAQIVDGRGLAEGTADAGFCFLLNYKGKTFARGSLVPRPNGFTTNVGSASAPAYQYLQTVQAALVRLAASAEVKQGSYEPRLLTLTAPPIRALWLTSDHGAPDLIYPLAGDSLALPQKIIAADEYVKLLRPVLKNPPVAGQPTAELLSAALGPTEAPARLKGLRFGPSPIGGAAAVLSTAENFSNTTLPDIGAATLADMSPAFHIYSLEGADIANGSGFAAAREKAWVYLLNSGGKTILRGDVRISAAGKPQVLGFVVGQQYLAEINPALEHLAGLAQVQNGSYEPRLVAASGPSFQVIWLASEKPGEPDLVYTLSAAAPGMPAQKLYPLEDFVNALRPLLKQHLAGN